MKIGKERATSWLLALVSKSRYVVRYKKQSIGVLELIPAYRAGRPE